MDHARHLASPSPTSSFLFHHSERPFKSSLLTPSLLTSASDVNNVEDCFSLTSSANNQAGSLQDRLQDSFGDSQDDRNNILVNHDDNNHNAASVNQDTIEHEHQHQNHCVISHSDSLNGVGGDEDDDDDGMHNMLSGSSTSSTTTMPLLTDNHSHHPFSRISLSEYSPLSLVDDCDNALTISPTSLVCGSHSFKSSLNNLKLENLDGVDVHVDDVVGDARSMSPSMLSANTNQNSNQNQLWSISSTAITQNPTLLNNSSTSFLLSHHHHQLSSLMQQLEPQSLDESPPLINHAMMLDPDHMSHHNRPSSEPPPGSELISDAAESKSGTAKPSSATQASSKTKGQQLKSKSTATKNVNLTPSASPSKSSRRNRSKTSRSKATGNKSNGQEQDSKAKTQAVQSLTGDSSYSSKAHLQLNHHAKLQELQQRLFGTPATNSASESAPSSVNANPDDAQPTTSVVKDEASTDSGNNDSRQPAVRKHTSKTNSDQEAKSSSSSSPSSEISATNGFFNQTIQQESAKQSAPVIQKTNPKPRSRQTPKRKSKSAKSNTGDSSSPSSVITGSNIFQRNVPTESVEPDTTTKSSDCIKLADLLSTTNSVDSNAINPSTIILGSNPANNDFGAICEQNGNVDGKRIQHIQLQVSPSLKFMANGNLVQSMSMQQQLANNIAVVSSGCASFSNQVICRPVNVMTSVNGNSGVASDEQIKCSIVPGNDWLKNPDVAMLPSNCNNANQQSSNVITAPTVSAITNNHTFGAHQIAIQVICQDGTSLVLPVSATSGLGAALSSNQQQQLQAVLTNNSKSSAGQRQTNQILPLISVSNILAQQQSSSNTNSSDANVAMPDNQTPNQASSNPAQSTGLAASSPTLAALLDAGSNRVGNCSDPNSALSHSIASSNLLRKFVNSNAELKRGKFSLQPGTQLGLTNNGSLVTICTANNVPTTPNHASNINLKLNHATQCIGDKRIKLENVTEVGGNIQTTFTLIEPQGLIVANSNDSKLLQTELNKHSDSPQQPKIALGFQSLPATSESISALQQQLNSNASSMKSSSDDATSNKQNKMTSSTGNRQVDPTQPFRCEHCNSTFTRLGNFTRHKKIHSAPTKDGQRFKCDVCSKSFLQRCDLARHLHIHRGTEPHRCNICGKGYIRHSDLVTHQRFHNKEKPFGCPNCHKGFCQRGDLNRHLRSIHLQLKPLLCPCCNRKFAKRDTLLKHLSTHHRGYPIELLPP